jgi:hypothetical protein
MNGWVYIPGGAKSVQTGFAAHPVSYSISNEGCYQGLKRETDYSTEVKNGGAVPILTRKSSCRGDKLIKNRNKLTSEPVCSTLGL